MDEGKSETCLCHEKRLRSELQYNRTIGRKVVDVSAQSSELQATAQRTMNRAGLVHLLIIYVVWGSTYLGMRVAVEGPNGFPPFAMGALRVLLAAVLLLGWARMRGNSLRLTKHEVTVLATTGLAMWVGGNGIVLWAEQHANSGFAALMLGTIPMWVAAMNAIIDRRLPRMLLTIALLVGLLGIASLSVPVLMTGTTKDIHALIALLLAPISWSIGTVIQRRQPIPVTPVLYSGYQQLFGGVGFLALALLLREHWHMPSSSAWWAFLYLVVFGSVIAFTSFGQALRLLPTNLVMTYSYVNPVIAVLLGFAILGEPITIWTVLGTTLIVLGVIGVFRANRETH